MEKNEEQEMELEALESIYPDEIEIFEETPKKVRFTFKTENYDEDDDGGWLNYFFIILLSSLKLHIPFKKLIINEIPLETVKELLIIYIFCGHPIDNFHRV